MPRRQEDLGGSALDSRQALLDGGDSGPAVVPGNPERSLLIQAIKHADNVPHMPPKKHCLPMSSPISPPGFGSEPPGRLRPQLSMPAEPGRISGRSSPFTESNRRFLAEMPAIPLIVFWLRNSTTSVCGRWERLTGARFRRATFDLTGLPPSQEEMDAFLADDSPNAFAKVVDRLLASPHYGERWGRHWLDVVRYADTAGETADYPVPDAWRYRNYVLDAFNADKPYNEFLREQIAGDVLAAQLPKDASTQRRADLIVATGYISIVPPFRF